MSDSDFDDNCVSGVRQDAHEEEAGLYGKGKAAGGNGCGAFPFGFCGNRSRTWMEEACRNGDASGGGTASSAFALQQYQSSHGGRHQSALYQ